MAPAAETIGRVVERVRPLVRLSPFAAGVAALGVVLFALAFAIGRATASDESKAAPALVPVRAAGAGVAVPQLSEAAPLPTLAARVKPVVRHVRVRPAARPRRAPIRPVAAPATAKPTPKPKPKPRQPVVIVGSG